MKRLFSLTIILFLFTSLTYSQKFANQGTIELGETLDFLAQPLL